MTDIHQSRILILDFGSQYTQLIARRLREIGVYCELHPYDLSPEEIRAFHPAGIILSGGPETVTAVASPRAPQIVFELGCPVLGICYGMQTMAAQLGGQVDTAQHREFGYAAVTTVTHSALLDGIEDHTQAEDSQLDVWMSHSDRVDQVPPGFQVILRTSSCPIAGMSHEEKRWYGVQFHPEVEHTRQGKRMLTRFVRDICGCELLWTTRNIIAETVEQIRAQVGDQKILLGLSGGVDSSVVAALLHQAVGKQLVCVFVDNGLLRQDEMAQVQEVFEKHRHLHIRYVDAQARFLEALAGQADPEMKRKIIGRVFIEVFEEEAQKCQDIYWLAQGTIYPDVIESAQATSGKAKVIKSHHNVGGLPEKMSLQLIEPLRELFKDEVRQIGLELGLPYDMVYRHPFPGPGLGVRILGEIKGEYATMLRQADAIFIEELHRHDLYHRVAQAFAVFLPVKSVAVMGDGRVYDYVIALRAVETTDFMTAHAARLPFEILEKIANRIMNEVRGISRVTYDISSKPPATIEWE